MPVPFWGVASKSKPTDDIMALIFENCEVDKSYYTFCYILK